MAQPTNLTEYCSGLQRSKLLTDIEIKTYRKRYLVEKQGSESDVEGFCKFLVQANALTEYQAALIQRGRADGFHIGGYIIQDRIGSGQSAGVYKARHDSGQIVALKVLPASKAKEGQNLLRFQREGKLLTQLNHSNVVRGYQIYQDGAIWFIAMEFIDGETLEETIKRRKRLPAGEATHIVCQLLAGLQHLHDRRLIHRDIKPANVMLTSSGDRDTWQSTVKILDIGIGRESATDDLDAEEPQLTSEGTVLGTPDYLSPEQARDPSTIDIRADIYSVGCVLYHLIAGWPPFQEKTVMAQMVKHATEAPAPLSSLVTGVPAGLQTVITKMLAKKRDDRYSTPKEAQADLRKFVPDDATEAEDSPVLPTYKEWLETESSLELPDEIKKHGSKPAKSLPTPKPPKPKPPAATSTTAKPVKPQQSSDPEVNVELVSWPTTAEPSESRSVFDLDRRDFLMLSAGASGVIIAGLTGLGLSRLLRNVGEPPPAPTTTDAN